MYFVKLRTPKKLVRKMPKKSCFWRLFEKQYSKDTKHFRNLKDTTFTIFIDHSSDNWVGENLS